MKNIIIAAALTIAAINAYAETKLLKGGYPSCITEESFHEMIKALTHKDEEQFMALATNGQCLMTDKGTKYSLLDYGFLGTSKIRIYLHGMSAVVYTNTENLMDQK